MSSSKTNVRSALSKLRQVRAGVSRLQLEGDLEEEQSGGDVEEAEVR
jgi:hypothetical protein